ncbi:MAG: hypothetical protein AB4352_06300 [Hormoscilla sp.]
MQFVMLGPAIPPEEEETTVVQFRSREDPLPGFCRDFPTSIGKSPGPVKTFKKPTCIRDRTNYRKRKGLTWTPDRV